MSIPYKQFVYPLVCAYNGMYIGLRINKGMLGYDPVAHSIITEAERIYLADQFTLEGLGNYERTKHDIDANPVVPKIEITLGDFFSIAGKSNGVPVDTVLASYLDELFDDPTLVYEIWLDRWSNDAATLEEVWFCGDIDYNTIPVQHRYGVLDALSVDAQYPLKLYTVTANFATERLMANINRTYNQSGVDWVPGSLMDFAYGNADTFAAIWTDGSADTHSIYCGSVAPFPYTPDFGKTGPQTTGLVRGYGFPQVSFGGHNYLPVLSPNIRNIPIEWLCGYIALYAGFDFGALDDNMMFDLYGQMINDPNTPTHWPLSLQAGPGPLGTGTGTWSDIYINANFLFGNGITIRNSYTGTSISLTGTSGNGGTYDVHLSGDFYDWTAAAGGIGTAYFGGNISGGVLTIIQCSDGTYTHALGDSGGGGVTYGAQFPIQFSGPFSGGNITLSGVFAGSTVNMYGTYSGASITLNGAGPLLYNWPCTIPLNGNIMALALWIAIQTGTWVDCQINLSGNVQLRWRSRRTKLPSDGGPAFFTGVNLHPVVQGVLGSDEAAIDVAKSSLTVQCQGDDLVLMAGPDKNNAVAITSPWRCHKFGSPISTSADTIFYNPNDIQFTNEQWWNRGATWMDQWLSITVDAKIADGPSNIGLNDDNYTGPKGIAIPTSLGWVGAPLLLWKNASGNYVFPFGEYLGHTGFQTSNNAMIGIAAILPAGLALPTDEMCGGYFDPQAALCQFYYQETVDNKLVLTQEYAGVLGDDGTIQGLRPGILMQTFLRGKVRVFTAHNVKQNVFEGTTTIEWIEVPIDGSGNVNYNNLLPQVSQVSGSGSQSSSSASSSSASSGSSSGSTGTSLTTQYPATVNSVELYSNNVLRETFTASILSANDATNTKRAQYGFRQYYGAGAHDSGHNSLILFTYIGTDKGNCYIANISPVVAGVHVKDYWYSVVDVVKTDLLDDNTNIYYWLKHRVWSEDFNTYLNQNILGCTHPNRRVFVKGIFKISWGGASGFGTATWLTMADAVAAMSDREILKADSSAPFTGTGFDINYPAAVNPTVQGGPASNSGIQVNFGTRMMPVAINMKCWKIGTTPGTSGSFEVFDMPVMNGHDAAGANVNSIFLQFGVRNYAGPAPFVIPYAGNGTLGAAMTEFASVLYVDLWGLCEIKGENATVS